MRALRTETQANDKVPGNYFFSFEIEYAECLRQDNLFYIRIFMKNVPVWSLEDKEYRA